MAKVKKEKTKAIAMAIVGTLFVYAVIIATVILTSKLGIEEVVWSEIRYYGRYMAVDYEYDGQNYSVIQIIPESKIENPTDGLKIKCHKNNPQNSFIDYSVETKHIVIIALFFTIVFGLVVLFVGKSLNKEIQTVENGMIVEAEVVKNTAGRVLVKWINPEDKKSYYYIFFKNRYERKWIEQIEKVFIVINRTNLKNFYVIGKEMV
ncbi:MAG: hypothetical protein K6D97_08155 [Clostridia bacterium]|nr:hypothetical protein [Clostridia bacterium]